MVEDSGDIYVNDDLKNKLEKLREWTEEREEEG